MSKTYDNSSSNGFGSMENNGKPFGAKSAYTKPVVKDGIKNPLVALRPPLKSITKSPTKPVAKKVVGRDYFLRKKK